MAKLAVVTTEWQIWAAEQQVYAAWAQAILSFVAILGAFGVLQFQRYLERREVLKAAGRLVVDGMLRLEIHASDASAENRKMLHTEEAQYYGFDNVRMAMEALPIAKLPADLISEFATFTNFVRQAERRLAKIEAVEAEQRKMNQLDMALNGPVGPNPVTRLEEELSEISRVAFKAYKRLAALFKKHGVDLSPWRK